MTIRVMCLLDIHPSISKKTTADHIFYLKCEVDNRNAIASVTIISFYSDGSKEFRRKVNQLELITQKLLYSMIIRICDIQVQLAIKPQRSRPIKCCRIARIDIGDTCNSGTI